MLPFFFNSDDENDQIWHYDGLPVPTKDEEYIMFSNESLDKVTETVSSHGNPAITYLISRSVLALSACILSPVGAPRWKMSGFEKYGTIMFVIPSSKYWP